MQGSRWSRLIPTRRRVAVYLFVLIGILVVRLALGIWAGYDLRSASDRVGSAYGGLDMTTLSPPSVAPAENRARILSAAVSLCVVSGAAQQRGQLSSAISGTLSNDPAKRGAILRQVVTDNGLALQVLATAESRSKTNWEIPYRDGAAMQLPSLLGIRDLGNVSVAAGLTSLADGNGDEAARHARLGLVLAGSLAHEPVFIVQLIRIAVAQEQYRLIREILAAGNPSAAALQALAARLEENTQDDPAVTGLTGELKYVNRMLDGIERGGQPWDRSNESGMTILTSSLAWFLRPAVMAARARVLDQFDRTIQYARPQPFEREGHKLRLPSDEPQPWWWRPITALSLTGFSRSISSSDVHRALGTLASTAVALRRCRLEKGSYPPSLDALAPAFLPHLPIDPFTGRALEYKVAGTGFELRGQTPPSTTAAREMFEWKASK